MPRTKIFMRRRGRRCRPSRPVRAKDCGGCENSGGFPVDPRLDVWNTERIDVDASAAQVRATDWLGDLPLVVLSLGRYDLLANVPEEVAARLGPIWDEQQQELAQLSTNSTHIIAEKSHWDMVSEQPDVVVDAIRQVVDAARER